MLYKMTPEDLRLIMIDPKMVELQGYNSVPHMLIPVVSDVKKAAAALKWLTAECASPNESSPRSPPKSVRRQ